MKLRSFIVRSCAMAMIFTSLTLQHVAAEGSGLATDNEISGWSVGPGYVAAPDPFLVDADNASQFIPYIGCLSLYRRHDAFDTHEAGSLGLAVGQRWELTDRLRLEASVYGEWQDTNRVQYYYGVTAAEVARGRPACAPNSSTSFGANAQVSFQLSPRSKLYIGADYNVLDNEVTDSLIVEDDSQYTAFVGCVYQLFDCIHHCTVFPAAGNSRSLS